jgi:two-component system response regulator VicR/two-component system response regulator ResD
VGTVLLIDEHPHLLDSLRSRFEREGFWVNCATTGERGLLSALHDRPGLIIINERISLRDGVPLAGLLGRHRELNDIPIIVLSRRAASNRVSVNMKRSARIQLPFRPSQLLKLVREAL